MQYATHHLLCLALCMAQDDVRKRAEGGDVAAQYQLAKRVHGAEARYWCSRAAETGYVVAMVLLGTWLLQGVNGENDPDQAETLFQRAAELGDKRAQFELAELLMQSEQYDLARQWLHHSATAELADAQYLLAKFYETGLGGEQSFAQAVEWCRHAAEQGLVQAERDLGMWHALGQGVDTHFKLAAEWLQLAAQQEDAGAQYCFAALLEYGLGVERDVYTAHQLFRQSEEECEDTEFEVFKEAMQQIYERNEAAIAAQASAAVINTSNCCAIL